MGRSCYTPTLLGQRYLVYQGSAEASQDGGGEEVPGYPEVVAGHLLDLLSRSRFGVFLKQCR